MKAPFGSVGSVAAFFAVRLARVLPPYWLTLAIESAVETGARMAHTFAWDVCSALVVMPFMRTRAFFLINGMGGAPTHLWLVQTVVVLYLLYPLVERAVFGAGPAVSQRWLLLVAALCCITKTVTLIWMYMHTESFFTEGKCSAESSWICSWYLVDTPWPRLQLSLSTSPIIKLPEFVLGVVLTHLTAGGGASGAAGGGAVRTAETTPSVGQPSGASDGDHAATAAWAAFSRPPSPPPPGPDRESADAVSPFAVACSMDVAILALLASPLVLPTSPRTQLLLDNNAQFLLHAVVFWALCSLPSLAGAGSSRGCFARCVDSRFVALLGDFAYTGYLLQIFPLAALGLFAGSGAYGEAGLQAYPNILRGDGWHLLLLAVSLLLLLPTAWTVTELSERLPPRALRGLARIFVATATATASESSSAAGGTAAPSKPCGGAAAAS